MKKLISILWISLLFLSCTNNNGGLESEIQTLKLTHITWACDCANWATTEDLANLSENALAEKSIFIEPAYDDLKLPDSLGNNGDVIKFVGQFYKKAGFPKGYHSFQDPEKSRVFRYTAFEVMKSNYQEHQDL